MQDNQREMLEYAKLHGIEFASFFDNEDNQSFKLLINASVQARASYIVALLHQLDDQAYAFATEAIQAYDNARLGGPTLKPKWSILWGLFTRW